MHEVDINGRHTIVTDEPLSLGGTDEGPAPHELLPAALASCIATMVAMYAEKRGWEIGDASADVSYDSETSPRRFEIQLNLPPGSRANNCGGWSASRRAVRCAGHWRQASRSRSGWSPESARARGLEGRRCG